MKLSTKELEQVAEMLGGRYVVKGFRQPSQSLEIEGTIYIQDILQIAEYIKNNTFKRFGDKEKPFDIFPVTIVMDRYEGCASGGKYLAFDCDFWDVPDEIEDADAIADHFWQTTTDTIGRGATPQDALDDLCARREEWRKEHNL